MPIGKNKTRLAVTLDLSTANRVEGLAETEKRSISAMLAILIDEALTNRNKTQNGFIRGSDYYKRAADDSDKD